MQRVVLLGLVLVVAGCASPDTALPDQNPPAMAGAPEHILEVPLSAGEPLLVARSNSTWFVSAVVDGTPHVLRTVDAGATWMNVTPAFQTGSQDLSMALGPEGQVWVVSLWRNDPYPLTDFGALCSAVATSGDDGSVWSINNEVCAAPVGAERPWLTYGAAGLGLLQQAGAQHKQPTLGIANNDGTWSFEAIPRTQFMYGPLTADGAGWSFPMVDGTLGNDVSSGNLGIEAAPQTLQLARRDSGGSWSFEQVSTDAPSARWPQLAITATTRMAGWLSDLAPGTTATNVGPEVPLHVKVASLKGGLWEERQLTANGTNHFLWLAANTTHIVPVWLHSDVAVHPETVPTDEPWRIQFETNGEIVTIPQPVHRGPICVFGFQGNCGADGRRSMGDFMSAELTEDGTLLVAYTDGTRATGPFNGPIQIAVIPL